MPTGRAGRYRSLREALIAAGLKKPPTALNALRNAWGKASHAERRQFIDEIKAAIVAASSPAVPSSPPPTPTSAPSMASSPPAPPWLPVVDADQRLMRECKKRIDLIMNSRRLKQGDVVGEMGFSRLDASLGNAMKSGTRIRPAMIHELENWLQRNKSVK